MKTAAEHLAWLMELAKPVCGCGCKVAVYEIRLVAAEVERLRAVAAKEIHTGLAVAAP